MYTNAIEAGIMPEDFWKMTLAESRAVIAARNKRRYDDIYDLSAMIRTAILSSFNSQVKFPEKQVEHHETHGNVNNWEKSKRYMEELMERRRNK